MKIRIENGKQTQPRLSYWIFLGVFILLMSGCTYSSTSTPVSHEVVTATNQPAALTVIVSSTPIATPDLITREPFFRTIETTLGSELPKVTGTLVIKKTNNWYTIIEVRFVDMTTHAQTAIPLLEGEFFDLLGMSPGGTYYAIRKWFGGEIEDQPLKTTPILFYNREGEEIATFDLPESRNFTPLWLNERQMIVDDPAYQWTSLDDPGPTALIASVFDPSQKLDKREPYLENFNFYELPLREWYEYSLHKNIYDPQMTRVLYPSFYADSATINLRDLEKGVDLLRIPTRGYGIHPIWSIDGDRFVTVIIKKIEDKNIYQSEIIVFDRNGNKLGQTNLGEEYAGYLNITSISLSPNGKMVAFKYSLMHESPPSNEILALFNIETKITTIFAQPKSMEYYSSIVQWSPMSDYLATTVQEVENDDETSVFILNPQTGDAYMFASGYQAAGGWMK